ncbi:MAG: type II toxin-antitoxin system RelE/ParE family toxin [Dehalococcoidia bacterium]
MPEWTCGLRRDNSERRYAQIAEAIRAWGPQVGPRYVTRINALRDAATIEDVYAMRQLDLHPLTGDRRGQHAIRLTGSVRLVVTIEDDAFIVEEVTDYHG